MNLPLACLWWGHQWRPVHISMVTSHDVCDRCRQWRERQHGKRVTAVGRWREEP